MIEKTIAAMTTVQVGLDDDFERDGNDSGNGDNDRLALRYTQNVLDQNNLTAGCSLT